MYFAKFPKVSQINSFTKFVKFPKLKSLGNYTEYLAKYLPNFAKEKTAVLLQFQ